MGKIKRAATLKIPVGDKKKLDNILKAEFFLMEAGISFDTGTGFGFRDWELDWSLKGAELVIRTVAEKT